MDERCTDRAGRTWVPWRRLAAIAGVVALSASGMLVTSGTPVSAGPAITHFGDPDIDGVIDPEQITVGPDGALWFTNAGDSDDSDGSDGSIGRITTGGVITLFDGPGIFYPSGITAGPDGALWFTNAGNAYSENQSDWGSIGRITTEGTVTKYTDASIGAPHRITTGPDGALWFTNSSREAIPSSIGRITTSGVVSSYTDTDFNITYDSLVFPYDITTGPDGALWVTEPLVNVEDPELPWGQQYFSAISRIQVAPDGSVTGFDRFDTGESLPGGITVGPDGALWFGTVFEWMGPGAPDQDGSSIGRITTGGAVTLYHDDRIHTARSIAAGPDGALWFTNQFGASIGRITTGGTVTTYPDPARRPYWITPGPDGAMWFTSSGSGFADDSIGRISTNLGATNQASQSFGNGGGSVSTGSAPSPSDPVGTTVQVLGPGTVSINETAASGPPVAGYALAGQRVDITAPTGTVNNPLTIQFAIDGSVLSPLGVTAATMAVLRNGVAVPPCTNPGLFQPAPNPCVFEREVLPGGGARIGIRTTAASRWNFGRAVPSVSLRAGDVSVTEKDKGAKQVKVTVTLSKKSTKAVSVSYATQNDTAKAGSDYRPVSGRLTFRPNKTKLKVKVPVIGNTVHEGTERFRLVLSNPTNATLSKPTAVITVRDND